MLFIVLCHTVNDFASKIKPVARGIDKSHGLQNAILGFTAVGCVGSEKCSRCARIREPAHACGAHRFCSLY